MTKMDISTIEQYRLLFDETNPNWHPEPEVNYLFIKHMAQHLQHKLASHGFLFVNEVLEAFNFKRTPDGQVSGWIRSEGYLVIDAELVDGSNETFIKFVPQGVIVNDITELC